MRVKIERCWGGAAYCYHRASFVDKQGIHRIERFSGETWNRSVAHCALDTLEHLYGINRSNVRFVHQ